METTLFDITLNTIDGKATTLAPFKGEVILIVNVASRCGFTKQYAELQSLYQEYKDRGFTILGFPCNQFRGQEPENNENIKAFAESCFRVTFPLFEKCDVKGPNQAPVYNYLQTHIEKKPWRFIPWNFTKILIDSKGNVLKHYLPTTSFTKIKKDIEALLP